MLIKIEIEGITPLMLDRFHEGLLISGPRPINSGDGLSPKDQCKQKLYLDSKDVPIIPADNMLKCIIEAGVFLKVGKKQLSTRDSTIVTSFLSITENFIPLNSKESWRVDSRAVVNQSTKGRHIAYRPIFDDWKLLFTIDLDILECQEKTARELVDRAGKCIGLGVLRPARKGRYGQFKVIHWQKQREKPS